MRTAIRTDRAPAPTAPYSQAIVAGDFLFVSGQGPMNLATGEFERADIGRSTRLTLENIRSILEAGGSSMEKVVKCNVYLRDINDFAAMNEVYATFFKPPAPARTTIQAGALPMGIPVEIECVALR